MRTGMSETLIPPDFKRCQAEQKYGSFMTLGPRPMIRCDNAPVVVITERKQPKGSMSLCAKCYEAACDQLGKRTFTTRLIGGARDIKG